MKANAGLGHAVAIVSSTGQVRMTRMIPLAPQQADDLKRICQEDVRLVRSVREALSASETPSIRPSMLVRQAITALSAYGTAGSTSGLAGAVIRLGMDLADFRRRHRLDNQAIVSGLDAWWLRRKEPEDSDLPRDHLDEIAKLSGAEPVYAAAKARDLALDHERLFNHARIITDVRPVFDTNKDGPIGAVIIHSLRLEVIENDRIVSYTVNMDPSDLEVLSEATKDALRKSNSIGSILNEKLQSNVLVSGGDPNDN